MIIFANSSVVCQCTSNKYIITTSDAQYKLWYDFIIINYTRNSIYWFYKNDFYINGEKIVKNTGVDKIFIIDGSIYYSSLERLECVKIDDCQSYVKLLVCMKKFKFKLGEIGESKSSTSDQYNGYQLGSIVPLRGPICYSRALVHVKNIAQPLILALCALSHARIYICRPLVIRIISEAYQMYIPRKKY